MHCRMLSGTPGLHLLDAPSGNQISMDIARCVLGGKLAPRREALAIETAHLNPLAWSTPFWSWALQRG